jgi:branched-chain amino acid transport system substrate-binding protein
MARALAKSGTTRASALLAELHHVDFEAPQGRVQIDGSNNHTYLTPRVGRVNARKRFELVWNPGVRVKPDPYFVTPSLDEWLALDPKAEHA